MYSVNLLPPEIGLQKAARRTTRLTVCSVLLVVALLGGLHTLKVLEVRRAEEARQAVEAEVAVVQAELASLAEFRQLHDTHEARDTLLASAMAEEISFARVLNDLSLAFPADSSMRSLKLSVTAGAALPAVAPEGGSIDLGESIAALSFEGYSTQEYDPGVRAVIVELEKIRSFFGPYLGAAAQEEIGDTGVTGFQGTVQLDADAYTRRYADGLPEEVGK